MTLRTPFFKVIAETREISDWVQSVTVTEDDRQVDALALTIADEHMTYVDGILEGSHVSVDMGYSEPNEHALLINSVVTKVEANYPAAGLSELRIKGEDVSIQMGLTERKKQWRDVTVTAIVREIGSRYPFAEIITSLVPDPVPARPIHQDAKTDLAFLLELAEDYNAKCFVELNEQGNEVLYFIPERQVVSARRLDRFPLRYRMGPDSNLITFQPSINSAYIDRLRDTNDVDEQGQPFSNTGEPPPIEPPVIPNPARLAQLSPDDHERVIDLNARSNIRRQSFRAQLAERRAVAGQVNRDPEDTRRTNQRLQTRTEGMTARGTIQGNVWFRAKSIVEVDGLNDRFNGEWYVNRVEHSISPRGFQTSFDCKR